MFILSCYLPIYLFQDHVNPGYATKKYRKTIFVRKFEVPNLKCLIFLKLDFFIAKILKNYIEGYDFSPYSQFNCYYTYLFNYHCNRKYQLFKKNRELYLINSKCNGV